MKEFVSIKQLAMALGMDRSFARKYVLKNGIRPHKRRTPDLGGQLSLALTVEEATLIRAKRQEEGFLSSVKVASKETGFFYVIRLVPELDPRRIKLGFAEDVGTRLSQHKTAAPTAVLVKCWPCKRSWEGTVIDCLTRSGCRLILNEVFECEDVETLVAKANQFFGLLPAPEQRPQLSDYSPQNT